jgi:hypothetical protein
MSALPTPKIVDLDDPLTPRAAPPAATPTATATSAPATRPARRRRASKPAAPRKASSPPSTTPDAPTFASDALVADFARLPEGLSDRLVDGLRALNDGRPRRSRINQQELLGALVDHYVTPDDVAELSVLVDDYRRRIHG